MRRENGERGRLRYAVETLCAAERARRTRAARLLSRLPDSGKIPTKLFWPCPAGVCGQPRRAPARPRVSEPKPSAPRHDRRVATLSRSPLSRRAFAKAGPLLAKRPARQAATRRSADSRHPDQQTRIPPTSPTGSHSAPRTRVRRRMRAGQSPSDQRSTGCGRVPGKLLVVNTGVKQCPLIPFSGPRAAPAAKRRTCAPPLAHPPPAATAVAFALSPDAAARPASIHAHAPASPIPPIAACAPAHAFACGRRRGCSDPRSAFEPCLAVPVVPCRASSTSKQQR